MSTKRFANGHRPFIKHELIEYLEWAGFSDVPTHLRDHDELIFRLGRKEVVDHLRVLIKQQDEQDVSLP